MKRSVCSQYLELTAASLGSSVEVLSGFPISVHPPEHQRKQSNLSHHLHLVRRIAAGFHVPTVGKPRDAVSISEWLVGTGSVCGWILLWLMIVLLAVFRASDLSATWPRMQNC